MPVSECDPNTRIICVGRDAYSRCCANKCPFLIKARWAKREGAKNHVIEVTCCAEGGKARNPEIERLKDPLCPNGLAWDYIKGQRLEYDPTKPPIIKCAYQPEPLIPLKTKLRGRMRKVTKKIKREQKVRDDKGQRTF